MMRALLIKDFRLVRGFVLLAVGMMFVPVVFGVGARLTAGRPNLPAEVWPSEGRAGWLANLWDDLPELVLIGTGIAMVIVPAIWGVLGARERRDRSGDLLFTLPVARWRVVVSKMLVGVVVWVGLIGLGVALQYAIHIVRPGWREPFFQNQSSAESLKPFILSFLSIGVGWLLGVSVRSDGVAGIGAIAGTIFLVVAIASSISAMMDRGWNYVEPRKVEDLVFITMLVFGVVTFVAGTVVALRRRTP